MGNDETEETWPWRGKLTKFKYFSFFTVEKKHEPVGKIFHSQSPFEGQERRNTNYREINHWGSSESGRKKFEWIDSEDISKCQGNLDKLNW